MALVSTVCKMLTVNKKHLTYQYQIGNSKLHCSVPRCGVSSRYNSEESFYRFPHQPEVRAQWLVKIRHKNFTPTNNTRVCCRHFKLEDFITTTTGRQKLVQGAVPCLFEWNNFCLPAPRCSVWERCPKCPSPPPDPIRDCWLWLRDGSNVTTGAWLLCNSIWVSGRERKVEAKSPGAATTDWISATAIEIWCS